MIKKDDIIPEQAEILKILEKIVGKSLPILDEIKFESFGIRIAGNSIIGLGLAKCNLTGFPESISEIKSLKDLTLNRNKIKKIPESIGNLIALQKLWLSQNLLKTIPETVGNLKDLREFYLDWNENFKKLPESIGNLISLRKLEVMSCNLSLIPQSVCNLKNLEVLDLYENKLKALPESIGNLKSLKKLHLNRNLLIKLPESIGGLESLEELRVYTNKLSTLPGSIGDVKSLIILSLGNNKIIKLPESIRNLKLLREIELQRNELKELPDSIGDLLVLVHFNLESNNLKYLPESIGNLVALKSLNLENNKLERLPDSFWKLKNLTGLIQRKNNWINEWTTIENYNALAVLEFCRGFASIIIYVSFSSEIEKTYRIDDFLKKLKNFEEICSIYSDDLEKIIESHILILFCTQDLIKTDMFRESIILASKNDIEIIPIRDSSVDWQELNQFDVHNDDLGFIDLGNKKGFTINKNNAKSLADELYDYLKHYKRSVNLFEPEERKITVQIENMKNIIEKFISSDIFETSIKAFSSKLKELNKELRNDQISPLDYFMKYVQIIDEGKD